jgi:TolB-like protein
MATAQSVGDGEDKFAHPTPDEVRACLRILLNHSEFNASERNKRFLTYVVEETLAGRADRIKAYNIALAAFDRNEDFDPLTDPIVRIEASRLRRSLEHYYLTAGKAERIRIDIPKGSYFATFTYNEDAPAPGERSVGDVGSAADVPTSPPAPKRPRWPRLATAAAVFVLLLGGFVAYGLMELGKRIGAGTAGARGPSVLVMPFEDTSGDAARSFIARGLTYEIIGHLTRFDDLFVFGSDTSFDLVSGADRPWPGIKSDYVLSGSVHAGAAKLRVSAILADAGSGQYLWTATIERDLSPASLMQIQSDIADQVAAAIAQPYGFVFEREAQAISSKPAESLMAYECVVRFRQYWRSYSDDDFEGVRTCLENTVADDPTYARGYASLALLYVDSHRFGFGGSQISFDPLARATELSEKAIELEPDLADGYLAQSMALWFCHDVAGSIAAARRGLDLNPHDADLMGELGFRYALLGRWDEAMPLVDEAYARNPGAPRGYHIATFLHAYMGGDYKSALEAALEVPTPQVIYGPIARAAAYGQLGESAKASAEVAEILRIDPDYAKHVDEDLSKRNIDPAIKRALIEGLLKAGLDVQVRPSGG